MGEETKVTAAPDLAARLAAAEEEIRRRDMALQSLTPGGSEFVNDPEACVRFVREFRDGQHAQILRLTTARREAEARAERAERERDVLGDSYALEIKARHAAESALAAAKTVAAATEEARREAEAVLAAEVEAHGETRKRLAEAEQRLDRIDAYAGERCEAFGCRPDPCGPVEYHDVEGVPLCAECWQECVDEALAPQEDRT